MGVNDIDIDIEKHNIPSMDPWFGQSQGHV